MKSMDRYHRHMLLVEIGKEGQRRLMNSSAVIIGCGALGGMTATILARAGVGKIRLVDRDFVEMKNLHRQVLFDEKDVGGMAPKALAAKEKLEKINSEIEIEAMVEDVNPFNIEKIIDGMDVVIDGTDNLETRFLINDACIKHNKPWIYGAVVETEGITMNIIPEETACLRCLIRNAGDVATCDTSGVLSTIATIIASFQATEAIKILAGRETRKEALHVDVWEGTFFPINVEKNPSCPTCSKHEFEFLKAEKYSRARILCAGNAVEIYPGERKEFSMEKLAERLKNLGEVEYNKYVLRFRGQGNDVTIFCDGRAIIRGVKDITRARSIYSKYVGL